MKYSNGRFASVSARISTRLGDGFFRFLAFGVEVRPDSVDLGLLIGLFIPVTLELIAYKAQALSLSAPPTS